MKKQVQVYVTSVLKACRKNHLNVFGNTSSSSSPSPPQLNIKRVAAPPPPPVALPQLPRYKPKCDMTSELFSSYGNPCLDLFYDVLPHGYIEYLCREIMTPCSKIDMYLKQLLPVAWSHNPPTTLKLIFNLLDSLDKTGKDHRDGFYTAMFWLYQNHPKTLAFNLPSIAGSFGSLTTALDILSQILEGQELFFHLDLYSEIEKPPGFSSPRAPSREEILAWARKAVEMYQCDPNYRILHDGVSDLFSDCLKSDIQNLNKHHQQQQSINDDDEDETSAAECLEITSAGLSCPDFDSDFNRKTLLCESIAKKVFLRESYPEYLGVEESDYTDRVRQRLIKEVLVPLRKALEDCDLDKDFNRWGYKKESKREPCAVKKYLKEVKAAGGGGKSKIDAGALLPHEIACYANDGDVGEVAELQWKVMVKHIRKRGKFKNCLAVYDNYRNAAVALAVMISELSEEPWKGKLMNFSRNPQMHSLQGDLKAKLKILKRMDMGQRKVDLELVFDSVLEVAVKNDLKPKQMIRRVFVFTSCVDLDKAAGYDSRSYCWKVQYEEIQRKFKDKGYKVPQIVFWKANNCLPAYAPYAQHGMGMMNRFNDNLVKSFLDNDGKIGPDHVMEAAISDPRYQNIVVVD